MPGCIQVVSSGDGVLVGEHQTPVARWILLIQKKKYRNIHQNTLIDQRWYVWNMKSKKNEKNWLKMYLQTPAKHTCHHHNCHHHHQRCHRVHQNNDWSPKSPPDMWTISPSRLLQQQMAVMWRLILHPEHGEYNSIQIWEHGEYNSTQIWEHGEYIHNVQSCTYGEYFI